MLLNYITYKPNKVFIKFYIQKGFVFLLDNETDHKNDACFALALVAHEKDKSLTEEGGIKQIFDELLTLNLPKNIPKIVFIEVKSLISLIKLRISI